VLMVEHVMRAVMNLSDEAWVLSNGRVLAHGTPREMAAHPSVIEAYLGHGAGKSTLNNTVCGLYPAFSGRVVFEGRDITRASTAEIVTAGLIQVPEGRRVFPNLSIQENLELG